MFKKIVLFAVLMKLSVSFSAEFQAPPVATGMLDRYTIQCEDANIDVDRKFVEECETLNNFCVDCGIYDSADKRLPLPNRSYLSTSVIKELSDLVALKERDTFTASLLQYTHVEQLLTLTMAADFLAVKPYTGLDRGEDFDRCDTLAERAAQLLVTRENLTRFAQDDRSLLALINNNLFLRKPLMRELLKIDPLYTPACRVLNGHKDCVSSVHFSSDGTRVVSASGDRTIRVWDVATGTCIAVLNGHTCVVSSAQFSLNSRQIISSSLDGTVRVWDVETGTCIAILNDHTRWVHSAQFNHNDTLIISASDDRTVRLWDLATDTCRVLNGHIYQVNSVQFSPNGTQIVSASADREIRLWDLHTPFQRIIAACQHNLSTAQLLMLLCRNNGEIAMQNRELPMALYETLPAPMRTWLAQQEREQQEQQAAFVTRLEEAARTVCERIVQERCARFIGIAKQMTIGVGALATCYEFYKWLS